MAEKRKKGISEEHLEDLSKEVWKNVIFSCCKKIDFQPTNKFSKDFSFKIHVQYTGKPVIYGY